MYGGEMKSWSKITDTEKVHIGIVLKKLRHFETNNNLLPLYVLNQMGHEVAYALEDPDLFSDQYIIKGGFKNKTFSNIDIHKDLLEESLLDLAKAMLISFNKKGDLLINASVRRAATAIETSGNKGLGYTTYVGDSLKKYELDKFSERLNRQF